MNKFDLQLNSEEKIKYRSKNWGNYIENFSLLFCIKASTLNSSNFGPSSFTKVKFCPKAYGIIKISEKIIRSGKTNYTAKIKG